MSSTRLSTRQPKQMEPSVLSRRQALSLTEQIKSNLDEFGALIKRARDGQAWKALGYASFSDWIQNAVGISRARAYQLINIAGLEEDLRAVAILPEDFTISTRSAQQIINFGTDSFFQMWEDRAGADPTENEAAYFTLLEEVRSSLNENETDVHTVSAIVVRDPNQHARIASQALLAQIDEFPRPEEVDEGRLTVVRAKLRDALDRIKEQLTEYREVGSQMDEANG